MKPRGYYAATDKQLKYLRILYQQASNLHVSIGYDTGKALSSGHMLKTVASKEIERIKELIAKARLA